MCEQLDLFGTARTSVPPPTVATIEPADLPPEDTALAAPGQTDLFGDLWLRVARAQNALEVFDLEAATAALHEAVVLYPLDRSLLDRAHLVEVLASRLRRASEGEPSMASALLAIEPFVPPFLASCWHGRVAQAIEDERGTGATAGGCPAGIHWLRAGAVARAESSLRTTLNYAPLDARALAYLGDALTLQGRLGEARTSYREALATAPRDVDYRQIADEAVRHLASLAEYDYELTEGAVEWTAAVGLLESVFAFPVTLPADWLDQAILGALPAGLQFYRWLVAERFARGDAERIACRRAMKALCPRLLQELLARRR